MYLRQLTDEVFSALRGYSGLENCVIIKAFPFAKKPAKLAHTVITVSPDTAVFENTALGEESAYGIYAVGIDVFTPQEQGSPAENGALDFVVSALLPLKPSKIELGGFKASDSLGAFCSHCRVTFSDLFNTEDD